MEDMGKKCMFDRARLSLTNLHLQRKNCHRNKLTTINPPETEIQWRIAIQVRCGRSWTTVSLGHQNPSAHFMLYIFSKGKPPKTSFFGSKDGEYGLL